MELIYMKMECLYPDIHFMSIMEREIYCMGILYFKDKRVQNLTHDSHGVWSAQITKSEKCFVSVKFINKDVESSCTCKFQGKHCIHKIAVYEAIVNSSNNRLILPKVEDVLLLSKEEQQRWKNDLCFQDIVYQINKSNSDIQTYNANTIINKVDPIEAFRQIMVLYNLGYDYEEVEKLLKFTLKNVSDAQTAKEIVTLLQITCPLEILLTTEKGIKVYFTILIELSLIMKSSEKVKEIINTTKIIVQSSGISDIDEKKKTRLKDLYLTKLALKIGDNQKIKEYYTGNLTSTKQCLLIVNYLYEKKDFEEALSICLKIFEQPLGEDTNEIILKKIIDIYGIIGNIEEQKKYILMLVKKDLHNIDLLKFLYRENAESWNSVFISLEPQILNTYNKNNKNELHKELNIRTNKKKQFISIMQGKPKTEETLEERYGYLMSHCINNPQDMIQFAMELNQYDRVKVIDIVSNYLQEEMAQAKRRNDYIKLSKQLKHYKDSGYKKEALILKNKFENLYPQKSAMIEALKIVTI